MHRELYLFDTSTYLNTTSNLTQKLIRTIQIANMPGPFGEAPVAKSLLDFQRVLSPTAGVRVSPLCLGAMNFGDAWTELMGKCDKKTTFEILDYFYEQGGNFIDTYVA
jgi:hypothetical protein